MKPKYTEVNAQTIDRWAEAGWEWGTPIDHDTYERARSGEWSVVLTPNKPVPRTWFGELGEAAVLGLASGGGQQIPVLAAQGARCTVLDYSERQLASERLVSAREGYEVTLIRADMTRPFPFADASFDLIFHPVSNCYIHDVLPVWRECARVLKPGGALLAGLDTGINYVFDDEETRLARRLPFNPLEDEDLYQTSLRNDWGLQFSHTIEEQLGGQLAAGLRLTDIYHDTNSRGPLRDHNVPSFFATRTVK